MFFLVKDAVNYFFLVTLQFEGHFIYNKSKSVDSTTSFNFKNPNKQLVKNI
jgi:hypothetical protein